MRFEYLADHPALVCELAQLHFRQWGYLRPEESIEVRTQRLRSYCRHVGIPTVIIALDGEELTGSAMLIPHEMGDRSGLTPWLDGVFVAPNFRRQGLGSALVQRMLAEAKSVGIRTLYLHTPDAQSLYSRLGWKVIETRELRGETVSVMAIKIAP